MQQLPRSPTIILGLVKSWGRASCHTFCQQRWCQVRYSAQEALRIWCPLLTQLWKTSSPPVAVTLVGVTCVPEWQDGKLCHLPTLSRMGHREGWRKGDSRQSWEAWWIEKQSALSHIHGAESKEGRRDERKNHQTQKKDIWYSLILTSKNPN